MFLRNLRKFGSASKLSLDSKAKFVILGAGDAGISAAKLLQRKSLASDLKDIKIIDKKTDYFYQSGQTKVAAGIYDLSSIKIPNAWRHLDGVEVIESLASKVVPEENYVITDSGEKIGYEHLIIASGIQPNLAAVKGLAEALEDPQAPVGSIYLPQYAEKFRKLRRDFKGGKAVFCQPLSPIKCYGATQKIVYTSACSWEHLNTEISLHLGGERMLVPQYFHEKLLSVAKGYNVEVNRLSELVEVRAKEKIAVFKEASGLKEVKFDLLQVSPPHLPPKFIASSGLAAPNGYAEVDIHTLRHKKFANVWALGDSADLPTPKTLAAVNTQVHILADQIAKALGKPSQNLLYNGYTACPVMVSKNEVLLCEFGYKGELMPTFSQTPQPSKLAFLLYTFFFRYTTLNGYNTYLYPIAKFVRSIAGRFGTPPDKL